MNKKLIGRLDYTGLNINTLSKAYYNYDFMTADWEDDLNYKRLILPAELHGLGTQAIVKSIVSRDDDNNLHDVIVSYDIMINGDVIIYSELPFSGRIQVEEAETWLNQQ